MTNQEEREYDHPSTMTELVRDQMRFEGAQVPEQAWILSDLDTWERNPHYNGPANPPHPEEDNYRTDDTSDGVPQLVSDERWDAEAQERNATWEQAMRPTSDDDILF